MPACSLCRVEDTPEHQQSGFHRFNARLFSEGKMPITEENYDKFERHREEGAHSNSVVDVPNHNVNKWHWEEKPFTVWATTRVKQLSRERLNFTIRDTQDVVKLRVKDIKGDAYINNRKGRVFCGFLFDCRYHIRATVNGEEVYGSLLVPDVANEDVDDISLADIKVEQGESAAREKVLSIVRREAKKKVQALFETLLKELKYYEKHPHEAAPELEYSSDDDDQEYKKPSSKEKKDDKKEEADKNSDDGAQQQSKDVTSTDELSLKTETLNDDTLQLPPGSTPTTPPPLVDMP